MTPSAEAILRELEQVLEQERASLRRLDASEIDLIADLKLSLCEKLKNCDRHDLPLDRVLSLRRALVHNQVLVAHMRDCARGMVELCGGERAAAYDSGGQRRMRGPVRLDTKV